MSAATGSVSVDRPLPQPSGRLIATSPYGGVVVRDGIVRGFYSKGDPDERMAYYAQLEAEEYERQYYADLDGERRLAAIAALIEFENDEDPPPGNWRLDTDSTVSADTFGQRRLALLT